MSKLKCPHCGYEWKYTGELLRATCPSCGKKLEVEGNEVLV